MPRVYAKRKPGDVIVNGAELVKRVNSRLWEIRCKCGESFIAQPSDSQGRCTKCGYIANSANRTKHGEAYNKQKKTTSRLYNIWLGIRARCNNKNNHKYSDYGGRGISICKEWDSYEAFKNWAVSNGYADNLSIDRVDVNGNYEPSNCRWITQKEQMRNTRNNHLLTYNGETMTMVEWAERCGIKYHTLKQRINKYGWTIERALTTCKHKPELNKYEREDKGNAASC